MENGNNSSDILIENPELHKIQSNTKKNKTTRFFQGEPNQHFIEIPSLPPNGFSSISTMPSSGSRTAGAFSQPGQNAAIYSKHERKAILGIVGKSKASQIIQNRNCG